MPMKSAFKLAPVPLVMFFVFLGCAENRWPSDIKPGVEIQWSLVGVDGGMRAWGKVVRIERDWLTVEYGGRVFQLPREKVLSISVRPKEQP
jgi:hypothetical protein